ncbi:RNA-directed DNA polymerase, eukaryota [Tanacetum coccineum]
MKEAKDKSEDIGRPDVCGRMGQDHCINGGETAMSEPGGKLKRNRVEAEAGTGVEERTEANPKEEKVPVWVRLHDIPLEGYTGVGISKMASTMGCPLAINTYTADMCSCAWERPSYARVLVEVSTDKEWKEQLGPEGQGKTKAIIRVEYEWRPPRCSLCKVYGHDLNNCMKHVVIEKEKEKLNPSKQGVVDKNGFQDTLFEGLEEVPLGGSAYTWCHKSAFKMSKFLSDHRLILLREASFDYGPTPFRFFHFWFDVDGFDKFVTDSWKDAPGDDSNAMRNLCGKLKFLKVKIRAWYADYRNNSKGSVTNFKEELRILDEFD